MLFFVCLVPRICLVATFDPTDMKQSDRHYLEYTKNLAEGRGYWGGNPYGPVGPERVYAFRPPLFPLAWSLIYTATDGAYTPMRVIFALLSSLGGVLLFFIGLRLFPGRAPAILGTVGYALYPPLVWWGVQLMTEPLFIFFVLATMLLLFRAWDDGGAWSCLAAGVCCGLAMLSRSVLGGYAPLVCLMFLFCFRGGRRRRLLLAFLFGAGIMLVMTPWIVRNARVLHAFVPTTTDGGHGFYVANNERALADPRGFYMPGPEEWKWLRRPGEERVGEIELQQRLYGAAFRFLISNPGTWARLFLRRLAWFWRFWPHSDFVGARETIVYAVSYVPLFPLMIAGLILAHLRFRENLRRYLLFDLLVVYMTLIHAFFLATLRYRVPLMPFLILFAAYALCRIVRRLSVSSGRAAS